MGSLRHAARPAEKGAGFVPVPDIPGTEKSVAACSVLWEGNMIAGVGTDILNMKSLSKDYLVKNDPFFAKTYSEKEISDAALREIPFYYYATRFAGKEAVFKSLGLSPDEHILMSEIEILNDKNGSPYVNLHGEMGKRAEEKGIDSIYISLTYEEDYACAFAVAEKKIRKE